MDHLVVCERCNHGATLHAEGGCGVARCACASTRHAVIDRTIELVRDDMYHQYRPERTAD